MKKLLTGAVALALSVSLAACSKADDAGSTPTSPVGASTSATPPSDTMSSGTTDDTGGTDTSTDTSTGSSTDTSTATAGPVDQSTPEAAMTSWLGAMVSGDGNTVCGLMASKGKTIESVPGAAAQCGKMITPMLDQIKQLSSAFEGLKISGATVNGDNATFESVTTEPALAAEVISSFKAVRIGGKWYVTQG